MTHAHLARSTSALLAFLLLSVPFTAAAQASATAAPRVDGTWAQLQVQSSVSTVPIVGDVVSETISLLLTTIEGESSQLQVRSTPCRITIKSPTDQVRTVIPPAMLRSLGTMTFEARVEAAPRGWHFVQPRKYNVLGARLRNPATDTLPTWARDMRVRDTDGDGHPGVTVRVEGLIDGSIYLTQRSWTALKGRLDGEEIRGLVDWKTDQSILGATHALLESGPDARPNPEKKRSYFRMRRIQPGTTCRELESRRDELFGP